MPRGTAARQPSDPDPDPDPRGNHYDVARRAQVQTLKTVGLKNTDITAKTGVKTREIQNIYRRAKERGYNPVVLPKAEDFITPQL